MNEAKLRNIYLKQITEAFERLDASMYFLDLYNKSNSIYNLEASILQIRKTLECIAYASIAPNKKAYENFRKSADTQKDYRKDFNATKITAQLNAINKDFYPRPLEPPIRKPEGNWHYEKKTSGFLTKKKFETIYDRLGKYLHADNPWGNDKGIKNLAKDLPVVYKQIHELMCLHVTKIITPEFKGVWVVEAGTPGVAPKILIGEADGDFIYK